ncbi:hypothetical protein Tco_0837107, partial [Tanacetum coccineum]
MKKCFDDYHELDYKLITMLQKHWWGIKDEESNGDDWSYYSPITNSKDNEHTSQLETNANPNYNPYLDVHQIFKTCSGTMNDDTIGTNQESLGKQEPIKDDDI